LQPICRADYIRAVRRLAAFLKRSPDTASAEDLRAFQLHMVDTGTAPPTINATLSGLKFFFDVTLGHAELLVKVQPVHQPRPLPVVLSCDEVARLIAAAPNPKYQAALSVAYGAGLRAAEVCALKVNKRSAALHCLAGTLCGRLLGIVVSSPTTCRPSTMPMICPALIPAVRFISDPRWCL